MWTYNVATLATTPKDQVRLLIGDTNSARPQLQDEEILYLLTTRFSPYGVAAECCRAIQAQLSSQVDQQAGTNKIFYSQAAKAYAVKAIEFETKAALSGAGMPYAGGISITDKQLQDMDGDRVPPQFAIGFMDALLPVPPVGNEEVEEFTLGPRV